jgi:hypothetical protein
MSKPVKANTDSLRGNTRWLRISTLVTLAILVVTGLTLYEQHHTSVEVRKQGAAREKELLKQSLVDVDPKEILALDPVLAEEPVAIHTHTVAVDGTLKSPLPSGVQIWIGSEKVNGDQYPKSPTNAFGVDGGGPCDVDLRANTFDCHDVYIGRTATTPGNYALFVGLATSSQARNLTELLKKQETKKEYGHAPPAGMQWLTTKLTRP